MPARWPEVYLLRHGQTEWNAAGRMQGGLDSALTGEGRAQAARQGGPAQASWKMKKFGNVQPKVSISKK